MASFKALAASLVSAACLAFAAGSAFAAETGLKAALQATMQRHIDGHLVAGAYLHLNTESGTVRRLYPMKAHPLVLRMGEFFVLCSDFKDEAGRSVNVDFYMARDDEAFVVFHSAVEDRAMLAQWMAEGKTQRVE